MRLHVVARNTEHGCPCFDKIFVFVAELHGFCGAAGGVVFGVEIQNDHFAQMGLIRNFEPARGNCFKFGERFVNDDCHTA